MWITKETDAVWVGMEQKGSQKCTIGITPILDS